ncbi:MAG TPA: hypothetical protein VGK48_25415 [Terriglobia bacterium]|jgi:hypothetical protein
MERNRQLIQPEIDQPSPRENAAGVLWVVIPYTTPELTRAALRHAAVCTDLNVYACVVDVQVVPFPCPIDQPPVNKDHARRRLRQLLSESGLPGQVAVLHTRDWIEGYSRVLQEKSLVIVATRKRWWVTREMKLARGLTNAGHQVMLLPIAR